MITMLLLLSLVGGLERFVCFPYVGNDNPNWRAHIFQRGRYTTNQMEYSGVISQLLFPYFNPILLISIYPIGILIF